MATVTTTAPPVPPPPASPSNATNSTIFSCTGALDECASIAILLSSLAFAVTLALLMRLCALTDYKRWRRARATVASEGSCTALLPGGIRLGAGRSRHHAPHTPNATVPSQGRTLSAPARLPSFRSTAPLAVELRLSWERLSYSVDRQAVLHPASGAVTPGLWIMLGPSGAGKSTQLGVLAGRKARGSIGGTVRLNGGRATATARRQLIGYMTQARVTTAMSA